MSCLTCIYISVDVDRGISGGEKRRVSVAMEMVMVPSIILLDEVRKLIAEKH